MANRAKRSTIWALSNEAFAAVIARNNSFNTARLDLGYGGSGGSTAATIRQRARKQGVDTSHFYQRKPADRKTVMQSLSSVLVEHSACTANSDLKSKILFVGLLDNKCAACGLLPTWNDMPLTLQLHHINGVRNDNRLANLSLLCPNCHTQTKTFAGKNIKKKNEEQYTEQYTIKTCPTCATKYKTKRIKQIYCTKKCQPSRTQQYRAKSNAEKCTTLPMCLTCGEHFRNKEGNGAAKYCSYTCAGKNSRKTQRPSSVVLGRLVWEQPISTISTYFGVSGNAVVKWCRNYSIETPKAGYWAKVYAGKVERQNCTPGVRHFWWYTSVGPMG
jgi:hypothetical protein